MFFEEMMNSYWNKKSGKKKGFTLVEVLVVVAIIAALSAVAIPFIGRSIVKAQAATNAANLRAAKGAFSTMLLQYPDDISAYATGVVSLIGQEAVNEQFEVNAAKSLFVEAPNAVAMKDGNTVVAEGDVMSVKITNGGENIRVTYNGLPIEYFAAVAENGTANAGDYQTDSDVIAAGSKIYQDKLTNKYNTTLDAVRGNLSEIASAVIRKPFDDLVNAFPGGAEEFNKMITYEKTHGIWPIQWTTTETEPAYKVPGTAANDYYKANNMGTLEGLSNTLAATPDGLLEWVALGNTIGNLNEVVNNPADKGDCMTCAANGVQVEGMLKDYATDIIDGVIPGYDPNGQTRCDGYVATNGVACSCGHGPNAHFSAENGLVGNTTTDMVDQACSKGGIHTYNTEHDCTKCGNPHPNGKAHDYTTGSYLKGVCTICDYCSCCAGGESNYEIAESYGVDIGICFGVNGCSHTKEAHKK